MATDPDDLEARIAQARAASVGGGAKRLGGLSPDAESARVLGLVWRIGFQFVSAIVVGVGLGLLIDRWLGISPVGLLILGLAGFAAAIRNIWRTISATETAVPAVRGKKDKKEDHAEPS